MMASGLVKQRAADMVRENPDMPSRTIARMLCKRWPKTYTTIERARSAVRNARGNMGKRWRHASVKDIVKPNGKAGWMPEEPPSIPSTAFPESLAKPRLPYIMPGRRVLILSDLHVPFHDSAAIHIAVEQGRRLQCDSILLNGDVMDFYCQSKFEIDPELRDLDDELDRGRNFLSWLRETFPRCEIVWKIGNHEERWKKYLWSNGGVLADSQRVREKLRLDHVLDLPNIGITIVDNRRMVKVGKLPVMHGHEFARGYTAPVNPARGLWLRASHTAMIGHHHQTSQHTEKNLANEMATCWSVGCLCDLSPEFAVTNRWNHGFAFVEVDDKGNFNVSNHTIYQGVVR